MALGNDQVVASGWRRLVASPHVAGHVLRFSDTGADVPPSVDTRTLLGCALLLETGRLATGALLSHYPVGVSRGAIVAPLSLAAAVAVLAVLGASTMRAVGLHRWRAWSPTERSYGIQVALLATIVFSVLVGPPPAERVLLVFVPYLCFGFYQELVYRGLVQSALVRQRAAPAGILLANALYTFGPLHWGYGARPAYSAAALFAATFAIGLYFGILYHRSGNLWLPAGFHALGNAFLVSRWGGQG